MIHFKDIFRNHHVILPVVHVQSFEQALRNLRIARETGCDGVFLINHSISHDELFEIHSAVFERFPNWWIGVNCLDLQPQDVFRKVTSEVAGVWVDNAAIDERQCNQHAADRIQSARMQSGWQGLYFGGVAFKYQRLVEDLDSAARLARRYMDVVTTSGPGTGQSAARRKIVAIRQALADFPLAIASGITIDNINNYMDLADCFLVATGISSSFTELDSTRVRALVKKVRSYSGRPMLSDGTRSTKPRIESPRHICFVCEWNEGRSVHLELSTRSKLKAKGSHIRVTSTGLSQGGRINQLRREYLLKLGIPLNEIEAHRSTVFGTAQTYADLILVAELGMKERLLSRWPILRGKVMTIEGFIRGFSPKNEPISESDAHIEDAAGHSPDEKRVLYSELEALATQIVARLLEIEQKRE